MAGWSPHRPVPLTRASEGPAGCRLALALLPDGLLDQITTTVSGVDDRMRPADLQLRRVQQLVVTGSSYPWVSTRNIHETRPRSAAIALPLRFEIVVRVTSMLLNSRTVPSTRVTSRSLKRPSLDRTKPRSGSDGSVYTEREWELAENLGVKLSWWPAFRVTTVRLLVLTDQMTPQNSSLLTPASTRIWRSTELALAGTVKPIKQAQTQRAARRRSDE